MNSIQTLLEDIAIARVQYIEAIATVTEKQASWKPRPQDWNVTEITEHLFWAEQGAIFGMWKTIEGIRNGSIRRVYESAHKDLPIEKIIEATWQPKEIVPVNAAPRLGGTLAFWKYSLASLQEVLSAFAKDLKEDELRLQAHPHPISGPLDFQQRFEFLRFHINRHQNQVMQMLAEFAK